MMTVFLLIVGGLINLVSYRRHLVVTHFEPPPHVNQGYAAAFVVGAIIWGGLLNLAYFLLTLIV